MKLSKTHFFGQISCVAIFLVTLFTGALRLELFHSINPLILDGQRWRERRKVVNYLQIIIIKNRAFLIKRKAVNWQRRERSAVDSCRRTNPTNYGNRKQWWHYSHLQCAIINCSHNYIAFSINLHYYNEI